MYEEAPDVEIDEVSGQLRSVFPQNGSIIQNSINRKLLYTKDEVNAHFAVITLVGSGVPTATGSDGQMYFDNVGLTLYVWANGVWNPISGGVTVDGVYLTQDGDYMITQDGDYLAYN